MTRPLLPAALRASAAGLHAPEAAVNLLIGHRYWLTRPDFAGEYIGTFPSFTDGTAMAAVCWPEAIAALDRGQLAGSGSENRILRLAASLADGVHPSRSPRRPQQPRRHQPGARGHRDPARRRTPPRPRPAMRCITLAAPETRHGRSPPAPHLAL